MHDAEQYAQTKTNTNPIPDRNRYRRRCPDPNARIQKFIHYMAIAAICDSGPLRVFATAGCHQLGFVLVLVLRCNAIAHRLYTFLHASLGVIY